MIVNNEYCSSIHCYVITIFVEWLVGERRMRGRRGGVQERAYNYIEG